MEDSGIPVFDFFWVGLGPLGGKIRGGISKHTEILVPVLSVLVKES
jgi:hypothetical protein